jgi:hypothetical protein
MTDTLVVVSTPYRFLVGLMGTKFDKWSTEKILLLSRAWNVEMAALGRWVLSPSVQG